MQKVALPSRSYSFADGKHCSWRTVEPPCRYWFNLVAGSEEVAHTLTKLYMQIADNNKLDWVEQQVFADGLIMDGRGYFDVRMDFSDHVEGEVRIKALDPLDVVIDPDAKDYDPKTWNEIFYTRWMTLDDIEEMYGQSQADRLRFISENGNSFGRDSVEWETRYGDTDDVDDFLGTVVLVKMSIVLSKPYVLLSGNIVKSLVSIVL